jgi:hypothetical protein
MLINDHPSSTVDLDKTLSQLIGSALWHLTPGALVLLYFAKASRMTKTARTSTFR